MAVTYSATPLSTHVVTRLEVHNRPLRTILCLAATDSLSLLISVGLSILVKALAQGDVHLESYLRLWPLLIVFLMVYAAIGLYSIVALSPPEELRRGTIASSVLFLLLGAVTMSLRGARQHFTWTLFLALGISVIALPLLRACARQLFAGEPWWGFPAVVFGAGRGAEQIVKAMKSDPAMSLKPIAVVDEFSRKPDVAGVPVFRSLNRPELLFPEGRHPYAVFVAQDLDSDRLQTLLSRYRAIFPHILVVPDLGGMSSLWVSSKDIGGMLGLEVSQHRIHDRLKRGIDIALALAFGLLVGPLCLLLAILSKIDSPGPIFYSQRRIGLKGRTFQAWKFRSMVTNSKEMLERHLAANPAARVEWEQSQKLKNDPRVTRVGKILRKTSMDELPQVWNVLKGEMSFVGPRPIVENEVHFYGERFELYKRVRGGITGLWQVSGRSDTTYEERVTLDAFYARNWSVWLDLCIIFRTFSVVLFGKGAY
jgi:Undecaprenyl-phosphate galactose phosphotransferase WbaP